MRYSTHDTTFSIWHESPEESRRLYDELIRLLRSRGFTVRPDPRIRKNYPTLNETHRVGRYRGEDLQFTLECCGYHVSLEFFQELVFDNPNGARYDFDKRRKMPYRVFLRCRWAEAIVHSWLAARGVPRRVKRGTPVGDPLAYFNDSWNMGYERSRGLQRFERGTDGWPNERELRSWQRTAADGAQVNHGDVVYFRKRGHPMRGRAYGGINGMWMVIYGPGPRDWSQEHVSHLHHAPLPRGRRFEDHSKRKRLESLLDAEVKRRNFERAIGLRDALTNLVQATGG